MYLFLELLDTKFVHMLFIAVPLLDYLRDPDVQAKIETAVEVSRGWLSEVM